MILAIIIVIIIITLNDEKDLKMPPNQKEYRDFM